MRDRVRIGVVGVGSVGQHHARILRSLPDAELAGVFDRRVERAAEIARNLAARAYPSLDALLADVDAVTIAVPTSHHASVATAALERRVDVLIEKPITSTVQEADALIRLAEAESRVIQVGHIERFNGAVRACEQYLDRPLFVQSDRLAPFVGRGTDVPVVLDLMIHDIDLVLSLVHDEVRSVVAVGVPVLTGNVDIANARIEFANGAVANITASRVSAEQQRKIRFFQPTGYLSLDLALGRGKFYRRRIPDAPIQEGSPVSLAEYLEAVELAGDAREPLQLEMQAFVRAVKRLGPPAVTAAEGRSALEVALKIVETIEAKLAHVPHPAST
ncbi:MAG: Gfo/Idh/MocA family oxidoreductase [Gemmatimonadetes bacterium]|nr:Gfo/Idh/MocA family oxidoreductase [Gemmatimonadota bacterium]